MDATCARKVASSSGVTASGFIRADKSQATLALTRSTDAYGRCWPSSTRARDHHHRDDYRTSRTAPAHGEGRLARSGSHKRGRDRPGNATFETELTSREAWDATQQSDLRFVAMSHATVAGWVAAGNVSDRWCHAGVVEHSVYADPDHQHRGI